MSVQIELTLATLEEQYKNNEISADMYRENDYKIFIDLIKALEWIEFHDTNEKQYWERLPITRPRSFLQVIHICDTDDIKNSKQRDPMFKSLWRKVAYGQLYSHEDVVKIINFVHNCLGLTKSDFENVNQHIFRLACKYWNHKLLTYLVDTIGLTFEHDMTKYIDKMMKEYEVRKGVTQYVIEWSEKEIIKRNQGGANNYSKAIENIMHNNKQSTFFMV